MWWGVVFCVLFLSGCAKLGHEKKGNQLTAKQNLFSKALRWKSYDLAAGVIRFKNPARTLVSTEPLNKITVTSYDLVSSIPDMEKGEAKAFMLFGYVQNATGKVFQVRHQQDWWYDEESKQWFLNSDMPDFKIPNE